jgi:hypothetical protein
MNNMESKTVYVMVLAISLILLVSGCQTQQKKEDATAGVYSGTGALQISFREGLPYSPVVKGENVDVGVELKNLGAEDITNGRIMVEGITSVNVPSQSFNIEGKATSTRSFGGPEYVDFNNIPIEGDQSIIVTACYPYKTVLSKNFCYDPTITAEARKEACVFKEANPISSGQGAPIAVTDVEIMRRERGGTARLIITIENKGGGNIRAPSAATSDCEGRLPSPDDINRVMLSKVEFSGKTGNCNPTVGTSVVLEGGKSVISCDFAGMGTTASLRQLNVELSYGYITQSSVKDIKVES